MIRSKNSKVPSIKPPSAVSISIKQLLSQQQLLDLKQTFDIFDQTGKGSIDPIQIQTIIQQLGLDKRNPSISQMIEDFQAKGEQINFDDFLQVIYGRLGDTKTKQGLLKIFNLYDQDQAGTINLQKIKKISRELGQTMPDQQIQQMIHSVHVINKTEDNIEFSFQQFYYIVTRKKY